MKFFTICFVLFVSLGIFILNGCDSSTDTKAYSVSAPTLVSPANFDSLVSITPTFRWSGAADKLEISTDQNLTHILHTYSVTDSSFTMPSSDALLNSSWYYWTAGSTSGNTVSWSTVVFAFKTKPN